MKNFINFNLKLAIFNVLSKFNIENSLQLIYLINNLYFIN